MGQSGSDLQSKFNQQKMQLKEELLFHFIGVTVVLDPELKAGCWLGTHIVYQCVMHVHIHTLIHT